MPSFSAITGLALYGREVVVVGFGPVGQGVAARARDLGAVVTVVDQTGKPLKGARVYATWGGIVSKSVSPVTKKTGMITLAYIPPLWFHQVEALAPHLAQRIWQTRPAQAAVPAALHSTLDAPLQRVAIPGGITKASPGVRRYGSFPSPSSVISPDITKVNRISPACLVQGATPTGRADASVLGSIAYLAAFTVVSLPIAIRAMRRRLIK